MNHNSWKAIFEQYKINQHNFNRKPYIITTKDNPIFFKTKTPIKPC